MDEGGSLMAMLCASFYLGAMPNRKTFDEREKYDHSGHPVRKRQPSDLKADIERRTSSTPSNRR